LLLSVVARLQALFGSIKVVADECEICFEARPRETQAALLRAASGSENNEVAGGPLRALQQLLPSNSGSYCEHLFEPR
jgi:hypothetical protein